MASDSLNELHRLVWIALLSALIGVGAYIFIPIGPVPFTMQPFFVLLAGFILGSWEGVLCAGLYLAGGLLGLPIFSGGSSGLGVLLGPTGGYLAGFLAAAGIAGLATGGRSKELSWARGLLFGVSGLLALYGLGILWLQRVLQISWLEAMGIGFVPFLPGAAMKLAAAVATYRFMANRGLLPS